MTQREIMALAKEAKSLPHLIRLLKENGSDGIFDEWAIRYFLDVRARERGIPFKGTFELTPLCNLDCKMCYVHLSKDQLCGKELLPAERWEQIMQEAIDAGMMYACLTGGECLTYPDFDRLYLFLHSKGVQVSILTNGVLLDENRIRFFQAHPPTSIQVTLYGESEETYERVTGHRCFERVMRNIRMADEAQLPIRLAITPNEYLGKSADALLRCAAETGIQFNLNSILMAPRTDTGRSQSVHDFTPEEYIQLMRLTRKLKGLDVPVECAIDSPDKPTTSSDEPIYGLRCGAGRSGFKITWFGRMIPCDRLFDKAIPIQENGFLAAWKAIHEVAQNFPLPRECPSCKYRYAARKCAGEHQSKTGHANPEQCKWCQAIIKAGFAKLAD